MSNEINKNSTRKWNQNIHFQVYLCLIHNLKYLFEFSKFLHSINENNEFMPWKESPSLIKIRKVQFYLINSFRSHGFQLMGLIGHKIQTYEVNK